MIWSVSMLSAGSTTVPEVSVVKRSIGWAPPSGELAGVGHPPAHGARGRSEWARKERTGAGSLTAFEVAIARADGVLATSDDIAIHAEAHGTAGFAPFGTGIEKHAVEAFCLGRTLHLL